MDESVSEFIVRTCRMFPKTPTNICETMHLQGSVRRQGYTASCDASVSIQGYTILSGSCVEFFIQPLHPYIDDFDCLKISSVLLAFTDENLVVPYDVCYRANAIDCFLIEPYPDFPAFVQLRLFGEMRYNWEHKTFEFFEDDIQTIAITSELVEIDSVDNDEDWCTVGPASRKLNYVKGPPSVDNVVSIWCPQWPKQAKNWPFRQRKYGWPTTAIIHEIVQNGCHVVFAKHPACRNDVHQCRLSFSVAEVILLQSWTPVQQIVYHMLRFFAKRELIRKDCPKEDEVLCTYHFKTLMLWSCEEMSPEWWNPLSVIKICGNLLEKLSHWLKETRCPNYFIPEANLFHEHFNPKIVEEAAKKLIHYCDSDILSLWFLEHYMYPYFIRVFDARFALAILGCVKELMLQTCEATKEDEPNEFKIRALNYYCSFRFRFDVKYTHHTVKKGFELAYLDFFKYLLRIGSPYENKLDFRPSAEIESCYWFYGSMLRILHAARLLDCKEMHCDSEWFVDEIRQVLIKPKFYRSKHHSMPRPFVLTNNCLTKSLLYFVRAQDLMENLIGSSNILEVQVVAEISKALLRKALECENYEIHAIVKASLSYMAALLFAASEYQSVIDLCLRVFMHEKPEKEETETLNAGCLLYIEDISKIIGFYLIFRKTKDASLHYTKRQFFIDLRLTPEVFSHYLTILSIERKARAFGPNKSFITSTFPLDVILMAITNRKFSRISTNRNSVLRVYQRTDPMNKLEALNEICLPNEESIIQLLMDFSLENITSFYNAVGKDFGIHCNTADCYRAAYLYQRRKYPEVLHLCQRILDERDLQTDSKKLAFANVMVLPPLDSFFDSEVRCLLGFHTLFYYLLPRSEFLQKSEKTCNWTFNQVFVQRIHSDDCLLSMVLEESYSKRCHYILGRHFLARYLKVRCLNDYWNSLSEAMVEFEKLKASLPFEYIIRCFLQQKLRQLQNGANANYCSG